MMQSVASHLRHCRLRLILQWPIGHRQGLVALGLGHVMVLNFELLPYVKVSSERYGP